MNIGRLKALVVLSATAAVGLLSAGSGSGSSSAPDHRVLADGDHERRPDPGSVMPRLTAWSSAPRDHDRPARVQAHGHAGHGPLRDHRPGGYDGVTVKNGVIRNFDDGIAGHRRGQRSPLEPDRLRDGLTGSSSAATRPRPRSVDDRLGERRRRHHHRRRIGQDPVDDASGNAGHGIDVSGNFASIKSSTASGNGANGIYVTGNGASIASSATSGTRTPASSSPATRPDQVGDRLGECGIGVAVQGDGASIASSIASGNGNTGIGVDGNFAAIKGNVANANGFPGGASDDTGPGSASSGYTTAPVGPTSPAATTTRPSAPPPCSAESEARYGSAFTRCPGRPAPWRAGRASGCRACGRRGRGSPPPPSA